MDHFEPTVSHQTSLLERPATAITTISKPLKMDTKVLNTKRCISLSENLDKSGKFFYGFSDNNREPENYYETAELFNGFSADVSESEKYNNKFELFRKSNTVPVFLPERLPQNVFRGGRMSKRIHVDVNSQRAKLRKRYRKNVRFSARLSGKSETEDESQSLNDANSQNFEETREHYSFHKKCEGDNSSTAYIKSLQRPPYAVEEEKKDHAQYSQTSEIHHDKKDDSTSTTKRGRGRPKRSETATVEVDAQLHHMDTTQKCKNSSKRSSSAACNSVQNTPEVVQEGKKDNAQQSETSDTHHNSRGDSTSTTKRGRGRPKRSDIAAVGTGSGVGDSKGDSTRTTKRGRGRPKRSDIAVMKVETQLHHIDTPQKCKDGSKRSWLAASNSVQKTPGELVVEGKNDRAEQSETSEIHHDSKDDSPSTTKRGRGRPKRSDTAVMKFEARLYYTDTPKQCKDGSKRSLRPSSAANNVVHETSDEVVVEEGKKDYAQHSGTSEIHPDSTGDSTRTTKRGRGRPKRSDTIKMEGETLLHHIDTPQKCKEDSKPSLSAACNSVQRTPDEMAVEEGKKDHAQQSETSDIHHNSKGGTSTSTSTTKRGRGRPKRSDTAAVGDSKGDITRTTKRGRGRPKRSDVAAVEVETQHHHIDAPQTCKEGSKRVFRSFSAASNSVEGKNDRAKQSETSEVHHDSNDGSTSTTKRNRGRPKRSDTAAMEVETQLHHIHAPQACKEDSKHSFRPSPAVCNLVQKTPDEVIVEEVKCVEGQFSLKCQIPLEGVIEKEGVQSQRSSSTEIHLEQRIKLHSPIKCAFGRPECSNKSEIDVQSPLLLLDSPQKYKESPNRSLNSSMTDDSVQKMPDKVTVEEEKGVELTLKCQIPLEGVIEKVAMQSRIVENERCLQSRRCSSENRPWNRIWTMLKPCVIKLKRVPGLEKVVRMTEWKDDSVHYPVVIKAFPRKIVGECIRRSPFPSTGIMSRLSEEKVESPARDTEDIFKIDLSDELALRKFCELKSISLIDSDSDDEDRGGVIEDRAPSPVLPLVLEDPASSPALSHVLEDRASSPIFSDSHDSQVSSPTVSHALEDRVSSHIHPNTDLDLHNCTQTISSADSLSSENLVPSGVQALNELGFLDNESFLFEKEHPSDNIWSDVLNFGEADESEVEDLLEVEEPLPSEAFIPCSDSEKPIEVDSVSGKVTISTGFGKSGLKTSNIKSKKQDLKGHVRKDIFLSDKEYLMNDPLMSNEHVEKTHFECSQSTQAQNMESEFLTSLIRPKTKHLKVSPNQGGEGKIEKGKKHKCHTASLCNTACNGKIQDGAREENTNGKNDKFCNVSCDINDVGTARGVNSVSKKPKYHENGSKPDSGSVLKSVCNASELKYRPSLSWLNENNVRLGKDKNGGSVDDDVKSKGLEDDCIEEIPTSGQLYRDLSTIPYVLKCNLQNRCRRCKNLNPCANANKNFKLFFTLTVGVGRGLSKPLMETLQNPEDSCEISRTTAYIAASAVDPRPTTILVAASPKTVQKVVPMYHSNLLMQLVAETDEMVKYEKRANSDMAIAETLRIKRALIAKKACSPTVENQYLPQSNQSTPNPVIMPSVQPRQCPPQSIQSTPNLVIMQSVQPRHPFMYKSNQIIAVKSKIENKSRFARKGLVSILPKALNKGANKSEGAVDEKKSGDSAHKQPADIQNNKASELGSGSPPRKRSKVPLKSGSIIPANSEGVATTDPSCNVITSHKMTEMGADILPSSSNFQTNEVCISPTKKLRLSSICNDGVHNATNTAVKKPVMDSSCSEKFKSASNFSSETVPQIITALPLNETANHRSGIKSGCTSGLAIESIDLTTGDEETIDRTNEPFPKLAVICSSLPELGFVRVQKTGDKFIINDQSVVSEPLEFDNVRELRTFLSARLAQLTYCHKSMILQWIVVTSGYLAVKTVPPTNPRFWLNPHSAAKTLTDMRDFDKQFKTPQHNTSVPLTASTSAVGSTSLSQPTKSGSSNPASTFKLVMESSCKVSQPCKFVGRQRKVLRINGRTVVINAPANSPKTQCGTPNQSVSSAPRIIVNPTVTKAPRGLSAPPSLPAPTVHQSLQSLSSNPPTTVLSTLVSPASRGRTLILPSRRMQQGNTIPVPLVPAASLAFPPRRGQTIRAPPKQIVATPGFVKCVTEPSSIQLRASETSTIGTTTVQSNAAPSGLASSRIPAIFTVPARYTTPSAQNPQPSHRPILIIRNGSSVKIHKP